MLKIKSADSCKYDILSLGEIMLRFDPGPGRIHTARQFAVWEGGGEYNVARGLRRCFGLRAGAITALADNPVGRLVEDFMLQGGVDVSLIKWVPYDGVGRQVRNGLNFTERGYGIRGAVGCSDRGNTAVSQLKAGDIDFDMIFGKLGSRWFHTGGIFAALSDTGGKERAREVNREIAQYVDVMIGNEEDFTACLGFEVEGLDANISAIDPANFRKMIERAVSVYPNFQAAATTLRTVRTATVNDWSAIVWSDGKFYQAKQRDGLEIFDRVGGGDSFASGLIYGFMEKGDPALAVEYGAAHGALAMTTPGDTSMARLAEVEKLVGGGGARVDR